MSQNMAQDWQDALTLNAKRYGINILEIHYNDEDLILDTATSIERYAQRHQIKKALNNHNVLKITAGTIPSNHPRSKCQRHDKQPLTQTEQEISQQIIDYLQFTAYQYQQVLHSQ